MRFFLIAILCTVVVQKAFSVLFVLPADSDDALRMLENRTLDSITWQKIRPFYSIPLNVPSGDFLILKKIFPDILKQLPSKQIISKKYIPWNEEQITHFFADFPQLIEFEPVLDFTVSGVNKGSISLSIANAGAEGAGAVQTAFRLTPLRYLTIRGRSTVWDDHARWLERLIVFEPSKSLSLQMGNIDWPDEYGLMSGRFSADSSNDSRYNNWLYGDAQSWNGFCLGYTKYKPSGDYLLHNLLYGHILDDNSQYAMQSGFSFCAYQGIDAYLVLDKNNKKQNNVYGGITYQFDTKKINMNLSVGGTSQNQRAIPFLAMLKYSYTSGHCNVSICHYNDTSGLSKSIKLHSNLVTVSDTQMFTKITDIDVLNELFFSEFPLVTLRLTCTLIDLQRPYNAICFTLNDENEVCRWKALAKVNLAENDENYSLGGTVTYTGFQPLSMTLESSVLYRDDQFCLEQLELLCMYPLQYVKITPAFYLKQRDRGSVPDMYGELRTVITFRKGTTSQIRIKCPIQANQFRKGVQFDCKASFLF